MSPTNKSQNQIFSRDLRVFKKTQERPNEEQEIKTTQNFKKDAKLRWRSDGTLWAILTTIPLTKQIKNTVDEYKINMCLSREKNSSSKM
jgi:hypothetical protein